MRGVQGMSRNMFLEAIKLEQRRIQRFMDLSRPGDSSRGSLCIIQRGSRSYVYERWQRKGEAERKIYLGTLDSESVRELFSIRLNELRMMLLQHDQKLLEKLEQQYRAYDFDSIVEEMPKSYRMAAKGNSFNQRYEEILKWANAPCQKNPVPFPDSENYAKDGTRTRSKGETIWYNLMQERGILFRYDCAMECIDGHGERKVLYPDFLILCFDGTLIIIEHLGRMWDLSYAMDFGKKSNWYFKEGFILGKNYFVTSDDLNFGTDSQMISRLVDRVEEMFYGF